MIPGLPYDDCFKFYPTTGQGQASFWKVGVSNAQVLSTEAPEP